ncbi:hypothetical protein BG015_004032 [Linnemannia schmuckeri]|uniref:BZIP domain-containing protein n=1 Tax=Linnemannia schmuckeri TaxID=64567 RepID=A0A9P5VCY0_9FUNG|nr:hypothetical protein BG015_004032 [Linnemannia schmuckeri]
MSLEAEFRRDANPTPTRFLLECGAFTPGFGLDSYNPFDASLKFLNTGTPKAELNPFDNSFKTPSTVISVVNNNTTTNLTSTTSTQAQHEAAKKQQQRGAERHPWTDIMMDDMAMPMPQMSPGLSSSSSSSASPSPPIASPPPSNFSLDQYQPSMTIPPHATDSHTYEHNPIFINATPSKKPIHRSEQSPRDPSPVSDSYSYSYHTHENHHQAPQQPKDNCFFDNTLTRENHSQQQAHYKNQNQSQSQSQFRSHDREDEEDGDDDDEDELEMMAGDSGVDDAMSALHMRRQSQASSMSSSEPSPSSSSTSSLSPIDRDLQPSTTKSGVTAKSKKTGQATGRKASPRKRSRGQDESPEVKRQKFLERNRMAASKCREKKRLQTLKTISDADEITARNQALHETLDELQEEVRRLKNQILCHRDCGCDVIQKFVQSSFDTTPINSSSSSSSSSSNSISSNGNSYPSAFTSTMHVFQDMIPVHSMQF